MRLNTIIAALVLCLSAQTVLADGVSLLAGSPFPHGRSDGGWYGQSKGGWELGAEYTRHWVDSVDVGLEVAYREMPNATDFTWMSAMKIAEISGNLRVRTNDKYKVVPYALVGLGLADINVEVDSPMARVSLSSTEVTLKLGGGIDILASKRMAVYAEAFAWNSKYVTMIPARAGVRFIL